MENTCNGCRRQPVAGIISHADDGNGRRLDSEITRCTECERFGDNDTAERVLDIVDWARSVSDLAWPIKDDDLHGNLEALGSALMGLVNDEGSQ